MTEVSRRQSRNRTVRDVVAAGNVPHRLTLFAPFDRLALLMLGEFWLAS